MSKPINRYENYDRVIGFVVNRASGVLRSSLSTRFAEEGFRVTPDEFAILARLHSGPLRQSAIVASTFRDAPAVSRSLASLMEQELVGCAPAPDDRRVNLVSLTSKGRRQFERLAQAANLNLDIAERGISPADLAITINVLTRIWENLSDDIKHVSSECP